MSTGTPSGVQIVYISPAGTTTDITGNVLYSDAYFEGQAAALPGSFSISVKDPNQTLSFATGGRIELTIDGTKMFGGFILQRTATFFLEADDTSSPVESRKWELEGADYNLLLDKRVLRRPANYTKVIPDITVDSGNCYDKFIISNKFDNFFDLDFSGGGVIDVSTKVSHVNDFSVDWVWPTQGETMRSVLDSLVIEGTLDDTNPGAVACVYWIDGSARLNWLALADNFSSWSFSDKPDGVSYIGWRSGAAVEDGTSVANEVFVWGGAAIGSKGDVVLGHKWNQDSIDAHGRWQLAESHPGEKGFKSQAQVNARANALVSGKTTGTSPVTGSQGLVNPDTQYRLTWFAHDVPESGGTRQHLRPGEAVALNLWSFSTDGGVSPLLLNVPLRQVRITFPTLPGNNPTGEKLAYVQFEGMFGIQMSDPVWWWKWLRTSRAKAQPAPVFTTDETSASFPYGSYYTGVPDPAPDGTRTQFWIQAPYIPGTVSVALNGLAQTKGTDFTEADPDTGEVDFTSPPAAGATIVVTCRTA